MNPSGPDQARRKVVLSLAMAGCAAQAIAQEAYPTKPIRLVVPFAPGGATDIIGRLLAEKLSPFYGQPIVIDNKPGVSGHLGAQIVAKAPGDGYTLMIGTIGIHAAHASYRKLAYNPSTELQPITLLGTSPNLVLVPVNSPFRTFADFLAEAKAAPGKVAYASAGPGSSVHMVTALFELSLGVRMTHVPYKGSGPALVDLIGGQVQVMFDNMSSGLPQVQAGKLRALAVTSAQRDSRVPQVPTVAESGVAGYSGTSWFTLAAPASMPSTLVDKLHKDVQRVMVMPDVASRLDQLGITYVPNTPAEAAAFFRTETTKWNRVIDAAKMHLD